MAAPNGGLITETNEQYYAGEQIVHLPNAADTIVFTFETELKLYSPSSASTTDPNFSQNNFTINFNTGGPGAGFNIPVTNYTLANNTFTRSGPFAAGYYQVLLKEKNYGSYSYVSMKNIVNNFIISYVGNGKLLPSLKRTDVVFHAKRAMQEFSYDILKSIKQQELTIPNNLTVPIPQDYVNYVKASWIDDLGVKHIILPTRLTSNPTEIPVQDASGVPTQDSYGNNIEANSTTESRWEAADMKKITGGYDERFENASIDNFTYHKMGTGERYGLNPETTQINGFFTINQREGTFSFSSDLVDKIIILEYISDGLAYTEDTRVPKLAEEAFYSYIANAVFSTRSNIPEYVVQRFKKEKLAKMRNAKLRLSNIKLEEISQVFRNKSKIIKH